METLPLECDCGCTETEERNVEMEDIAGTYTPVEWSLYCKGCGRYLGHFAYGHWEYQEIEKLEKYGKSNCNNGRIGFWQDNFHAEP